MQPCIRRSARLALLALLAGPLVACGGAEEAEPRRSTYQDWEQRPMPDPSMSPRPSRDPSASGGLTAEQMRNARPMPLGEDRGLRCDEVGLDDPNCEPPRRRGGGQSSPQGSGESSVR